MKYLILGLGKSGMAAYHLLKNEGHEVAGYDDDPSLQEGLTGSSVTPPTLDPFECIVVSPGFSPSHPFYQSALLKGKKVISEVELALTRLNQPSLAITGTNGKTTVTLLVTHILNHAGLQAKSLGNIGTPVASYIAQPQEILVIELSSFQLERLEGRFFDSGVILNITPDHLDRYPTLESYAETKCRLQQLIKPQGSLWVHEQILREFPFLLSAKVQSYGNSFELILPTRYKGHDRENIIAAWLLCRAFGVSMERFLAALEGFCFPPHRMERIASINEVVYINDSKSTNIDATIKGVETLEGRVILIVGGVHKGSSYRPWRISFAHKVIQILAIGSASSLIEEELSDLYPIKCYPSLQEAFLQAKQIASPGDTVLFSPGCSSFDQFKDYVQRGNLFKKYVLEEGKNEP